MRRAALVAFACLASVGCSGGAETGPGATSAETRPAPSALPSPPPAASAAPSARADAPQLAPSTASATEREAAVMKALRGDVDPKLVSTEATDFGAPLDPTLRDRIAPRAQPPQVRMGASTVEGRLPPEVIQRIVRQSFGRFRACYEQALKGSPTLEGKVEVHFTIGTDGSVTAVSERNSTIPDAQMKVCVTNGFRSLSFPQPEGGVVKVTYPIQFSPPVE